MECIKKTGLLLCGIMLIALQGCVRNDLEDCPPSIRYALSFDYLLHTVADTSGKQKNLFPEEVDRMYVYVFDNATGICVYADTTLTGPFTKDYLYPLPLNGGTYDIIVWGWGRNTGSPNLIRSTGVIPSPIVPGKTTIGEARCILNELNAGGGSNFYKKIEKNFYGEIPGRYLPPFISRIDTLYMKNIANLVRIIIPDARQLASHNVDWKAMKIVIEGDNGSYKFNSNSGAALKYPLYGDYYPDAPMIDPANSHVVYHPYSTFYNDSIVRYDPVSLVDQWTSSNPNDSILVVEISSLRFTAGDVNLMIKIDWDNDGIYDIQFPLVPLLESAVGSPKQLGLDLNHRWQILYNVSNTYVTGNLGGVSVYSIMNWHTIVQLETISGWPW